MQCVKCGNELTKGAAFCSRCGQKVSANELADDAPIYLAEVKGMLKSGILSGQQKGYS